jgi:hypothetical protein
MLGCLPHETGIPQLNDNRFNRRPLGCFIGAEMLGGEVKR